MKKTRYSEKFKQAMVQKLVAPGAPGITILARENDVSCANLHRWREKYVKDRGMEKSKKQPAGDWTPEQKFQAVMETFFMEDHQLGEYLRKNGLHSSDIEQWKLDCQSGLKSTVGRPKKDPEVFELRHKKKELEKNLRRKDKALAEMSARIVLLKKSHEIWGASEDDE